MYLSRVTSNLHPVKMFCNCCLRKQTFCIQFVSIFIKYIPISCPNLSIHIKNYDRLILLSLIMHLMNCMKKYGISVSVTTDYIITY